MDTCRVCVRVNREDTDFLVFVALHIRDKHRLLEKQLLLDNDIVKDIYYDYDYEDNEGELTYQLLLHWEKKYGLNYGTLIRACKSIGASDETLKHVFQYDH
jgi:hypothetical protein